MTCCRPPLAKRHRFCYHLTSAPRSTLSTIDDSSTAPRNCSVSMAMFLLSSYHAGRSQFVSIGSRRSSTVAMISDVPQGSVLGPLPFSIFTTPVGSLIRSFAIQYHQCADDNLLYTADAATTWHIQNDLLLKPTRTEALVTETRRQLTKIYQSAGIMVTGAIVPFVNKIRVLGVTIDSELSFDDHIAGVVRACNFHIRAMHHIRRLLNHDAANMIACSIVCSRLDYCNAVLYGVTTHNTSRLQAVQNSLARVVCNAPYQSSATSLRRTLHWLPIAERITYKIAMLQFKVRLHHNRPTSLSWSSTTRHRGHCVRP